MQISNGKMAKTNYLYDNMTYYLLFNWFFFTNVFSSLKNVVLDKSMSIGNGYGFFLQWDAKTIKKTDYICNQS